MNDTNGFDIISDIRKRYSGFNQSDIIDTYKEYFIIKRNNATAFDLYDNCKYELWKFNEKSMEMSKIDLGNVIYLEFNDNFLIVHKFDYYASKNYINVYQLPDFTKFMSSSAFNVKIKDSKDYYIISELEEDDNGDLYTKRNRLINKNNMEIILPWKYQIKDSIILNLNKTQYGIHALLYDRDNRTGVVWVPNRIVKKGFKNFCQYDKDQILIYDDLEHAQIIDYKGNLIKELKIDINVQSSRRLHIFDFKNGIAKYKITDPSYYSSFQTYGVIDSNGKIINSNCQDAYILNSNNYIFAKNYCYNLSRTNSQSNNKVILGKSISKPKNELILSKGVNYSYIINTNGDIIMSFPFRANDFEIKDNFIVIKKDFGRFLYNLVEKKEILRDVAYEINIINNEFIIFNDEIKKISDLTKKGEDDSRDLSTENTDKIDKPKTKFLSRFFKRKKHTQ